MVNMYMEYFLISAKFVPLKYYTLSSQLQRLTSFSVGCSGRRILSPGQIAVMRKWSIDLSETIMFTLVNFLHQNPKIVFSGYSYTGTLTSNKCPLLKKMSQRSWGIYNR